RLLLPGGFGGFRHRSRPLLEKGLRRGVVEDLADIIRRLVGGASIDEPLLVVDLGKRDEEQRFAVRQRRPSDAKRPRSLLRWWRGDRSLSGTVPAARAGLCRAICYNPTCLRAR